MSTLFTTEQFTCQAILSPKSLPYAQGPRSPENAKQRLINQILLQNQANNRLQAHQEALQNTVYDLRKLIELTNEESQETIEHLHEEIQKIQKKRAQYKAVLNFVQGNDSHLQKCMLFWDKLV